MQLICLSQNNETSVFYAVPFKMNWPLVSIAMHRISHSDAALRVITDLSHCLSSCWKLAGSCDTKCAFRDIIQCMIGYDKICDMIYPHFFLLRSHIFMISNFLFFCFLLVKLFLFISNEKNFMMFSRFQWN